MAPCDDEASEDRSGQTLLGKWRLDALLGEGGAAVVYSATHRNGARGAVKLLRTAESEMGRRFIREGYIANRVDHPAVVRALDDDVAEDGTPFLVMELLDGQSLHELATARGGRLPVAEVLPVMRDVLDALAAAHAQGIVHRDIKPENIFVTREGAIKVLDFGIAHLPGEEGPKSSKTQAGMLMGTPAFMSPEQSRARWDLVGPASDVWAVGATMFTLLSGQFVHQADTIPELLAVTFTKEARSLKSVEPGVPVRVAAIVDRALALRIADRWSSASEMRDALVGLESTLDSLAPLAPAPPPVRDWVLSRPDAMTVGEADASNGASLSAITLPPERPAARGRRGRVLPALDVAAGVAAVIASLHGMGSAPSSAETALRHRLESPREELRIEPAGGSIVASEAARAAPSPSASVAEPAGSAPRPLLRARGVRQHHDLFDHRY